MRKYRIKNLAPGRKRFLLTCEDKTKKGERLQIEFTLVPISYDKPSDLGSIWLKAGYLKEKQETFWHVDTHVSDDNGSFNSDYNPTICTEEFVYLGRVHSRFVYDFDWVLPATAENVKVIMEEIERRAFGEVVE